MRKRQVATKRTIHYFLKTLPFSIAITILMIPFSRGPEAGDYHAGDTLNCQYCHTMHYSISREVHTAGFIPNSLGPSGPYQKLLKNNANDLCLSCHDGQLCGFPDVMERYGSTTFIRQGGMLNRISSSSPYEHWKGHTLGSTATAPGGTFSDPGGLTCIDCHMPHGVMAQYRKVEQAIAIWVEQEVLQPGSHGILPHSRIHQLISWVRQLPQGPR